MELTKNTELAKIRDFPPFEEFKTLLFSNCMIPDWSDSLEMLQKKCPDWRAADILFGLKRLLQMLDTGVPVYHRYRKDMPGDAGLFFLPGKPGAPFALICPGGGYQAVCTLKEGFPVAARLNEMGCHAFIFCYPVNEEGVTKKAVGELRAVISFIMEHAGQFRTSKKDFALFGFSSGAHLAAEWGTQNHGFSAFGLPAPAAMVLSYPATDLRLLENHPMGKKLTQTMLGHDYEEPELKEYNIGDQIHPAYPPVYMWHCKDDPVIPFETSVCLERRLLECHVPCKMRLYDTGGHGTGLSTGLEPDGWLEEAVTFWKQQRVKGI